MRFADAVIIGAAKSGTTALHVNLDSHPRIRSKWWCVHYFEDTWGKGRDDRVYAKRFRDSGADTVCIDGAPSYMLFPYVFDRMRLVIPGAKLLMLLRDPVRRAFSHYNMNYVRKHDVGSFGERIASDFGKLPIQFEPGCWRVENRIRHNVVYRGMYIDQILAILERWPREQLHIEIAERFLSCQEQVIRRVLGFLGHEFHEKMDVGRHHVSNYEDRVMSQEHGACLREFYAPYNARLREFLQDPLSEWCV